ncbi:MAG: TolC family protein [Bryobacteraceae bacterium]
MIEASGTGIRACVVFLSALLATGAALAQQDTLHLTLAEAEKIALQSNPALSAAEFTAGAAAQVPNEVRAGLEPNFFGSFTGVGADSGSRLAAGGLNNPVVYNRIGSGLSLSQLITDFGRTSNLISEAKFSAAAQDQVTQTVHAGILLDTDRAYFAVLRAHSLLTVALQTVSARQLVADQVAQLAASKLKSQLDVSFANVNLADAKLQLLDAQNGLQASEAQLATAMGIPGQVGFVLAEEPTPDAPPDRINPLIDHAIRQRPELANLRFQSTAAERFFQAEKALAYPSVGVIATAGFVPAGQAAIPGRYGAFGANVTVPIFNGGLFKARRTEAELRAQAATKRIQDQENRIVRDVRIAYLNALNAYDRMSLTAQLLDQAKLGQDLAQSRYDLGLGSIIELSQAQLNFTSAQIANAGAKYDYQTQHSLLQYEIGDLR